MPHPYGKDQTKFVNGFGDHVRGVILQKSGEL